MVGFKRKNKKEKEQSRQNIRVPEANVCLDTTAQLPRVTPEDMMRYNNNNNIPNNNNQQGYNAGYNNQQRYSNNNQQGYNNQQYNHQQQNNQNNGNSQNNYQNVQQINRGLFNESDGSNQQTRQLDRRDIVQGISQPPSRRHRYIVNPDFRTTETLNKLKVRTILRDNSRDFDPPIDLDSLTLASNVLIDNIIASAIETITMTKPRQSQNNMNQYPQNNQMGNSYGINERQNRNSNINIEVV